MEAIIKTDKINDTNLDKISEQVEAVICEEEKNFGVVASPVTHSSIISKDIIEALNDNEVGDAWLFVNLLRNQFCYDHSCGQWFIWDGHYWRQDFIGDVYVAIDAVVNKYSEEAERQAWARINAAKKQNMDAGKRAELLEKELLKRVRDLQALYRQHNVLTISAKGIGSLGISGDEWDKHPYLLGCKNGVVDLKTGEFRDGRPEDYIKTVIPTEWKGINEPAPMWEKFHLEIFESKVELVAYIQRLLGYTITGSTKDHIIAVFWGRHGRNGKGTLFETLKFVLGPLIEPIASEMLTGDPRKRSSAGPSPDIMSLRGRRLVWASEADEKSQFDVGKIKWLTGADTLTGRQLYGKNQVTFQPTHKIILLTNHKPQLSSSDQAMWERLHLVPFTLSYIDDPKKDYQRQRDPDLPEKLKNEASGILAWLVRGCLEWQRIGLNPPKIVVDATAQYQKDEDIIGLFLSDCTDEVLGERVRARPLYKVYKKWCEDFGYKWLSEKVFGGKMTDYYTRNGDREGNYYEGIRLKPILLLDSEDGQETPGVVLQMDENPVVANDDWSSF